MHYLAAGLGPGFPSAVHRDLDNGLASVRKLAASAQASTRRSLVRDWAAMIALDGVLDRGYRLTGGRPARYRTATLDAAVNWSSLQAYRRRPAPCRTAPTTSGSPAPTARSRGSDIRSIAFDGSAGFPRRPVEWRVDTSAIDHPGDPALHSAAAAPSIAASSAASPCRGRARGSRSPPGTTSPPASTSPSSRSRGRREDRQPARRPDDHDATRAMLSVRGASPGPTGRSGGGPFPRWVAASYDLAAYRGQSVPLAFRYVTDPRGLVPRLVDRQRSPRERRP